MADLKDSISLEIQAGTKATDNGITKLINDLKQLHNGMDVGTKGVKSLSNQFKELGINLSTSKLKSSISSVNSDLLRYVTTNGQVVNVNRKVKNGIESYSVSLKKVNNELKKHNSLWSAFTKGVSGAIVKLRIIYDTISNIAYKMGDIVDGASEYEEALNLFLVSMGDQAEEATAWVERFSTALYLDPANVMQYMGSLNSLISGLGVGADKSYLMSKNLTQLAYDLASFKNMKFEEAFRKIQSGISGEIEPLRNVGVALSQNTLQELANSLGIQQRVAEMSEAQKAQLRYIQIIKSTTQWQGDMARTLISPANAVRVLREQFTLLGRAVGRVFLPMIMEVLPYVMALTQILTDLANKLASFLGYEFTDIDYSSLGNISSGIGDIGDEAESTTKKLNTMLAPFDELNVVQNKSQSAGNGAGGIGGDLGLDLPEYDALAGLTDKFKNRIEDAKNNLSLLLEIVKYIGVAFASWKIASSVLSFMDYLKTMSATGSLQKTLGLTLTIAGTTLVYDSSKKLQVSDLSPEVIFENILGTTTSVGGVYLLSGGNLYLAGITLVVELGMTLNALFKNDQIKETLGTNGGFWQSIWAIIQQSTSDFFDYWGGIISDSWNTFWSYWGGVLDGLPGFFQLFGNAVKDSWNGFWSYWGGIISDSWNTFWSYWGSVVRTSLNDFTSYWGEVLGKVGTTIGNWTGSVVQFFKDLPSKIAQGLKAIPEIFANAFNNAKNKVKSIWGNITSLFNKGGKIFDGIKEGIADVFKTMVNSLIKGINKVIATPFNAINKTLNSIRSTKIPVINVKPFSGLWDKNPIPVPKIPSLYAKGGFPKTGEFFMAREAGAEMVGRIGNQTAVANNDQITTSITNALITALNNYDFGSKPGTTVVNIGGRKVYEGVGDYVDSENDRYGTSYVHI